MPMVTWGLLTKSAEDATKIEEEIDDRIASHNSDPDSHGLSGMALYAHRSGDVLDHLDEAVKNTKISSRARAHTAVVIDTSPQIDIIRPNGVGNETNITDIWPAPPNWDLVNDVTPDGLDTLISNVTNSYLRDLYTLSDIASFPTPIAKIVVYFHCIAYPAYSPAVRVKPAIRTNNQTVDGDEVVLQGSWTTHSQEWVNNPVTGQPWTLDEVNALEAGISLIGNGVDIWAVCTQLYVKVFGTEGESNGDFTDIQDAIDYVEGLDRGSVFITPGTYKISQSLVIQKSDVNLVGQGAASIIELDNNVNDDVIKLHSVSGLLERVKVQNLKIDGNGANQSAGQGIAAIQSGAGTGVSDITIKDLEIIACKDNAVDFDYLTSPKRCLVENNYIHNNLSLGISIAVGKDNLVTDNIIEDNSSVGINFNNSEHNLAVNNRIKGGTTGISLSNGEKKDIVSGNSIHNVSASAISLSSSASHTVVEGNFIESCDIGINIVSAVLGSCKYNTISDNIILSCSHYGIRSKNDTDVDGRNCYNTITGNTIYDVTYEAIILEGVTHHTVVGNTSDRSISLFHNNRSPKIYSLHNTITGNAVKGIGENFTGVDYNIIVGNMVPTSGVYTIGPNSEIGHNIE